MEYMKSLIELICFVWEYRIFFSFHAITIVYMFLLPVCTYVQCTLFHTTLISVTNSKKLASEVLSHHRVSRSNECIQQKQQENSNRVENCNCYQFRSLIVFAKIKFIYILDRVSYKEKT